MELCQNNSLCFFFFTEIIHYSSINLGLYKYTAAFSTGIEHTLLTIKNIPYAYDMCGLNGIDRFHHKVCKFYHKVMPHLSKSVLHGWNLYHFNQSKEG